jgi:hypothetical protein
MNTEPWAPAPMPYEPGHLPPVSAAHAASELLEEDDGVTPGLGTEVEMLGYLTLALFIVGLIGFGVVLWN